MYAWPSGQVAPVSFELCKMKWEIFTLCVLISIVLAQLPDDQPSVVVNPHIKTIISSLESDDDNSPEEYISLTFDDDGGYGSLTQLTLEPVPPAPSPFSYALFEPLEPKEPSFGNQVHVLPPLPPRKHGVIPIRFSQPQVFGKPEIAIARPNLDDPVIFEPKLGDADIKLRDDDDDGKY